MSEEGGAILVTSSYDHTIKFWNTNKSTWECSKTIELPNDQIVNKMQISLDKKYLACACSNSIKLYDLSDSHDIVQKASVAYLVTFNEMTIIN